MKSPSGIPVTRLILALTLVLTGCQADPTDPVASATPDFRPLFVPGGGGTFTALAVGGAHTCALRSDGVVECWGYDSFGQAPATKTAASGVFTDVDAGAEYTCAVRSDGAVECWGYNASGQAPAVKVPATSAFVRVAAHVGHTCALRGDGVAECWGFSGSGQAPATRTAMAPHHFVGIGVGIDHSCGVREDGVVECWGYSGSGQAPATRTAAVGSFATVAGGPSHTCALRADGVGECWGTSSDGAAPASLTAASGAFVQLDTFFQHTCAVRGDGVAECVGRNTRGQAPATRAPTTGDFTSVAVGVDHTCALRDDGVVECWGSDGSGQAPATRTASGGGGTTVLPTATFDAPSNVDEGAGAMLSLVDAEVPGHDGSPFTYAFDCGGGYGSFSASNSTTCPTPDGPAEIEVRGTVKDRDGDSREYVATVLVENVAPAVATLQGAEILAGETYVEGGSFSDPGDDTHGATVDWDEGGGPGALVLAGDGFSLSHTYGTPGEYAVVVEVTDSDGAVGTGIATVKVLTPEEFVDDLESEIEDLGAGGVLSGGQVVSLTLRLRLILRGAELGRVRAALRQIDAFVNHVEGLVEENVLTAEQGDALIESAQRLAVSIGGI